MKLEYYINLSERGDFFADVRTPDGQTILEIHGHDIFDDGFMSHENDIDGLLQYMIGLNIVPEYTTIESAN